MLRLDIIPIQLEDLPESVRAIVSPDASLELRMQMARAAVPLPPDDLILALAFLAGDKADAVSRTAGETIDGLPAGVLSTTIPGLTHAGVLDHLARRHGRSHANLWSMVAGNRNSADSTVCYIASKGSGPVLEQIASNQMRFQRFPSIVEALYYNVEARMGTVSTVLENAVRLGLDLSQIPGYQEIVASIVGPQAIAKVTGSKAAAVPATAVPASKPADGSDVEPGPQLDLASLLDSPEVLAELAESAALLDQPGAVLDEDSFFLILQEAVSDTDGLERERPEENEKESAALWAKIAKMSVAQKVRYALLGDESVRALLIRDTRRMVYLSVLKSPRLTDKEIAGFAKSRNLSEEVIRLIAGDRDWTKSYVVKLSLVTNPKCPPNTAVNFLRIMNTKDIKNISGSRDVPGYVARQAKQILMNREQGKRN